MAQSLGSAAAAADAADAGPQPRPQPVFMAAKKKGCKQKKCSNWKGGKCRCGRE